MATPLPFTSIDAGEMYGCALTAEGAAHCWGYNNAGQLGIGRGGDQPLPVPVAGGLAFTRLVAGGYHACGITAAGALYCWGGNVFRQLGLGDDPAASLAVPNRVLGGP